MRGQHRFAAAMVFMLMLGVESFCQAPPPPPPPPPPLGPPPQPVGNPVTTSKANLGKALFWDEQMSSPKTVACGTCHQGAAGGSDPRSIAGITGSLHPGIDNVFGNNDDVIGSPGVPNGNAAGFFQSVANYGIRPQVTNRHSMSAINAAYGRELFWDGRARGEFRDPITNTVVLATSAALESQVAGPPVNTIEMGHIGRNWSDVAARIAAVKPLALSPSVPAALNTWIAGRTYPQLFAEAFGTGEVTPVRIAMAIATYERTLFSNQTPFNQLLQGNDTLTPSERNGRGLFGQMGCAGCHSGALLSDNQFHNTGVRPIPEDQGRFIVTGNNADRGAFRTPSLLNVAQRAPYFHNGRFATLEEVVEFYNRGGDFNPPNKDPRVRPLNLTAQQKTDLAAFMRRPLTDPRVANESPPFDRPTLYAESNRVPVVVGQGKAGLGGIVPTLVAVEPPLAGNRAFAVGVENARGGAQAVLVISGSDPGTSQIPATGSFARVAVTLAGAGQGQGNGSAVIGIPNTNPALIGATLFGRWYITDAAAVGGFSATAAFRFTVFGEAAAQAGAGSYWEMVE